MKILREYYVKVTWPCFCHGRAVYSSVLKRRRHTNLETKCLRCCVTEKFDMVKSKWGLAFAAVAMVLASLLASIGICSTFFGVKPSREGW